MPWNPEPEGIRCRLSELGVPQVMLEERLEDPSTVVELSKRFLLTQNRRPHDGMSPADYPTPLELFDLVIQTGREHAGKRANIARRMARRHVDGLVLSLGTMKHATMGSSRARMSMGFSGKRPFSDSELQTIAGACSVSEEWLVNGTLWTTDPTTATREILKEGQPGIPIIQKTVVRPSWLAGYQTAVATACMIIDEIAEWNLPLFWRMKANAGALLNYWIKQVEAEFDGLWNETNTDLSRRRSNHCKFAPYFPIIYPRLPLNMHIYPLSSYLAQSERSVTK